MNSFFRILTLGTFLLLPLSAANAQAPSVSPISNISINAGVSLTVNVVAVDLSGDAITLTSSLPGFVTLNPPTTGTGAVVTTLTLAPVAGDVGTFAGSVAAAAGGESDTTKFQITVAAAGSNQAPVVTAPAALTAAESTNLMFTVTAVDADADAITSLSAFGVPAGASFAANGTNTSGTFSWTPSFTQSGDYDVVFTAAGVLSAGAATTHIHVDNVAQLSIADIDNVTLVEGSTVTVNVNATGPASGTIGLTSSLPSFATLNAPTTSTGTGTLATTITISPPTGTAGIHQASITATASGQTDTEGFTITVTPVAGVPEAKATLLGNFNTHKKSICFRVRPMNASFDVLNVTLSSITLRFGGTSITALASKTHVTWDCDEGDDGDHDEDCDDCDGDGDEFDDCERDTLNCDPSGIHACFSMSDIQGLFGDATLPGSFVDATVQGALTTGGTFVATIGSKFPGNSNGNHGKKGLNVKARPNPLNPETTITFTLSQPGRIRILVYDLQGRLVKTLLDENRTVGDQTVTWNGSNSRDVGVSSGVYFFRVQAPQGEEVHRVTVWKEAPQRGCIR